jgi:hypothetical protein
VKCLTHGFERRRCAFIVEERGFIVDELCLGAKKLESSSLCMLK